MELPFINTSLIYLSNDQPTTCKLCGSRTNWIGDFSHTNAKLILHEFKDANCSFLFYEEEGKFNE